MDRDWMFLIIGLFGGALLSVPFGYLVQYTSNPLANKYRNWSNLREQKRATRSLEEAKERISKIEKELSVVRWYAENPTSLNALAFNAIQKLVLHLTHIVILGFSILLIESPKELKLIFALALWGIWFFGTSSLDRDGAVKRIFSKVRDFQAFEKQTKDQVAELQVVVSKSENNL